MVILLSIISAIGIGIGAAWVLSGPRQQPDRAAEACWSTLADYLNLDYDAGGLLQGPRISGQIEGMQVYMDTLHQVRDGRKALFTRFVLSEENLPEGLDKRSKAKPSDDPIKRAIAQVTRRNVSELIKRIGATLSGGKVRWLREGAVWHPEHTRDIIRRIAQICEFLAIPKEDIAMKLVTACKDENLPNGHRDEMRRLLFENFSGSEACIAIAGDLLDDPDPNARLEAAKALGADGAKALARLAQAPDVPRDIREQAVSTLISAVDASVALPLLRTVIQSGHSDISRSALNLIRRNRFLPAMRIMLDAARDPGNSSDVICNIVDTVGEIGDSSAQTVLVGLLKHDYLMVRRRAAVALGRIGSLSSVPQLRQCASEASSNRRFRELCQRAIKKIEKRHGGSSLDFDAADAS